MKIIMLDALTLGDFDSKIFEKFGDFIAYPTTQPSQILERCKDADIIITNKVVLDSDIIPALSKLKLICVSATGTNNIDLEAAKKCNIAVKNVAGYSTHAVAQHTFMLALSLLGQLPYYTDYVKKGEWVKSEIFCHLGHELKDLYAKEWGIIGFGAIGRQVCNIAQAFGANVSYHSTSGRNTQAEIPHKDLESLLTQSDIISIHAPLNDSTYNLIAESELKKLKKGAILLNLGRGGIVNEKDLANRLIEQDFYFGTDVLEKEPMQTNHVLLDPRIAHKILITPHVAWGYSETKKHLLELVAQNIESYISKA